MKPLLIALLLIIVFTDGIYAQLGVVSPRTIQESYLTTAYNFTIQANIHFTGTLTTPGPQTITISNPQRSPLGVAGANLNHYIRISGGVGTAEVVLITGGSCSTGQTGPCTLTFTTINAHSGAFVITSATAGCQETYNANVSANGVNVVFGPGTYSFYAPCTIADSATTVKGSGKTATTIVQQTANVDIFKFVAGSGTQSGNVIKDMQIAGAVGSTSGYALTITNQTHFTAESLLLYRVASGVKVITSVWVSINYVTLENIAAGGDGLFVASGSNNTVYVHRLITNSGTTFRASIRIEECGDVAITDSELVDGTYGLELVPSSGQTVTAVRVSGTYFDGTASHGVYIHPALGGTVEKIRMVQIWASSVGDGVNIGGAGTVQGVSLVDSQLRDCQSNGLRIANGSSIIVQGSRINNNENSTGILLDIAVPRLIVSNNFIGNNVDGAAIGIQENGIYAGAGLGSGTVITGNVFLGNVTNDLFLPTGVYSGVTLDGPGIHDKSVTVASSTTITPTTSWASIIYVTGTTPITTLTASTWTGRKVTIIKTDASSVAIGGGGNIPGSRTLSQNESLTLTWDGSNWY